MGMQGMKPGSANTEIRKHLGLMALCFALLSSCQADDITGPGTTAPGVIASGFGVPDGIAVIGETEFLFAERSGVVHHYVNGKVTQVKGIPPTQVYDVYGGFLDVSLHPDFQNNHLVYIAYDNASFNLSVARFELRNDRAQNLTVIYQSQEFSIGSRIAWEDDSHFFLSFGVGGDPYPEPGPQDLNSDRGKIHRLMADGQIPSDNPHFRGSANPSTIWSYGHRNPQGLYYDAADQILYESEHGPLGGDELNIITAGGNYGWPLFSYGRNYDNTPVSYMTEEEAATISILPFMHWNPNFRVAPSGLLLVENSPFTSWNGSFLLGALNLQHLIRYDPAGDKTEIVLANVGRVRDVAQLPSGKLLISVDSGSPNPSDPGRIIQLLPSGAFP